MANKKSLKTRIKELDNARDAFINGYNELKEFPHKEYDVYDRLRKKAIKDGILPPDIDD